MDYWYIWYEVFENGRSVGKGRYFRAYKYKSNAERRARQMWSKDLFNPMTDTWIKRRWIVSQTNPWEDVYIFNTRSEAEGFINSVKLLADRYSVVTRQDANDLVGGSTWNYIDSRLGWFIHQLHDLYVQESTRVFVVEFPTAQLVRN